MSSHEEFFCGGTDTRLRENLNIRLDSQTYALLRAIAEKRQSTPSDLVRTRILRELTKEGATCKKTKKAIS